MKRNTFYIITAFGLLTMLVLSTLINAGVFKTIEPLNTEMCSVIEANMNGQPLTRGGETKLSGAEDITFIPGTNQALVSAYDRRIEVADAKAAIQGAIYLYDLDTKSFTKISPLLTDFKPHGISLYTDKKGVMRLFVVDHANEKHQIQIFEFKEQTLTLVKTISHESIDSPNDIHAVGPEQFYVTNDHGFTDGLMRVLEDYLMLPFSNVVYFDGVNAKEVASGMPYANGINSNQAGDEIYVTSVTSLKLHMYHRDVRSNELSLYKSINTGTGIDNIEVDENGDLWLGAHPQLLKFAAHAKDKDKRSASEVLKVTISDGSYDVKTVYRNTGQPLSGSSVAAVKVNRLLIGSVFDPMILDCQL